ncbi:hypothetical protein MTR67_018667 [Solanum verrucosum]|uniref:Uncharacterized protein n=1 Tax=Solanum verrucosum TaxID=315347 RepID=A0AAF0TLS1_SOLVR|nr:hypothetical protein MTR67_018667 [Solanum verrucosum]
MFSDPNSFPICFSLTTESGRYKTGHAPSFASAPTPRNKGEYNGQKSKNCRAKPAQSQGTVAQEVAALDRAAPGGATSDTGGGANHLYAITSRQEQ